LVLNGSDETELALYALCGPEHLPEPLHPFGFPQGWLKEIGFGAEVTWEVPQPQPIDEDNGYHVHSDCNVPPGIQRPPI